MSAIPDSTTLLTPTDKATIAGLLGQDAFVGDRPADSGPGLTLPVDLPVPTHAPSPEFLARGLQHFTDGLPESTIDVQV